MNLLFQIQQVITYQLIGVLSKVMQVKNNSQRKLLFDFFQAEEQRREKETEIQSLKANAEKAAEETLNQAKKSADSKRQKENEALNRAKAEISEALTVYQKLESTLSDFTRPKHQLNMDYDPLERLREIKAKLEEAQANFLLKTLEGNNSAYACASNAIQLGRKILQTIEYYHQAKFDASSSIQETRSEWQSLQNRESVRYVQSELSTVQNQVNLAEQHFQTDTLSDYHQALEISRQVSSRISELTRLADQRETEHQRKISKIEKGIGYGFLYGLLGSLAGWPGACVGGCVGCIAGNSDAGAIIGIIIGASLGFIIGFVSCLADYLKE